MFRARSTLGPGEREIYDYPGLYGKKSEGDRFANIRMQEEEAKITTITRFQCLPGLYERIPVCPHGLLPERYD